MKIIKEHENQSIIARRKFKLSTDQLETELKTNTVKEVAKKYGVTTSTIYRHSNPTITLPKG